MSDPKAQPTQTAKANPPANTQPDPKAQPKAQTVQVEIVRDFWDAEGNRRTAGTIVEVPVEAALEGIETGALRRAQKAGK